MDYQFIMNVAQIITGLATLLVAFVLLYQLRQQHRDAQRELVLAINEQRQSLAISLADNPELSKINYRGGHDFNDLKNQEERTRFFRIFAAEMNLSNIAEQYSDLLHVSVHSPKTVFMASTISPMVASSFAAATIGGTRFAPSRDVSSTRLSAVSTFT